MARADLTGQRFGRWTVVGGTMATFGGRLRHLWDCKCECGTTRAIANDALISGKSTQCRNCSNRHKAALQSRLTHGASQTRLYNIWTIMRRRCDDKMCADFDRYGGRGIRVCGEWEYDFQAFQGWALANGYQDDLTIDRRDNDGNYEPGNCRWVSRTVQNRNRRDNLRYEYRGQSLTLPEIAETDGISHALLRQRVRRDGLTISEALAKPIRGHGRKDNEDVLGI